MDIVEYTDIGDLQRILHFLKQCRHEQAGGDYEQIGDILWAMRDLAYRPDGSICLLRSGEESPVSALGM